MAVRFAFVMGSDFHAASVDERGLGGSESAVTYLARALVRAGHKASVYTTHGVTTEAYGVRFQPLSLVNGQILFPRSLFHGFDVVVLKNGLFETAPTLRRHLPPEASLWLWNGHADTEQANLPLSDHEVVRCFEKVIFLSNWQKQKTQWKYPTLVSLDCRIVEHAISPHFEDLFQSFEELRAQKSQKHLRLAYTSTPFRGLHKLAHIHPIVRNEFPDCCTQVFSGMSLYGATQVEDRFQSLYRQLESLPALSLEKPLPQAELAKRLRSVSCLFYPNTFPETSCIAVREALAAGLRVVTSKLGALEETCRENATLVEPGPHFVERYADALLQELKQCGTQAWCERQFAQAQDFSQKDRWSARVPTWVSLARAAQTHRNRSVLTQASGR